MDTKNKALARTHLGFFVMGIVPVFAQLIPWDAVSIVCGRMLIASLTMLVIMIIQRKFWKPTLKNEWVALIGTGILLAIHWSTFFMAIKIADIPLAVVSAGTIPVFTAFIEPLTHRKLPGGIDLVLSAIVFFGIYTLTEEFDLQSASTLGIIFGTICAFTKSLRDVWSKKLIREHGSIPTMFFQLVIGGIVLLPFFDIANSSFNAASITNLVILAVFGTATAHTLAVSGMSKISASTMTLLGNLAAIYQIILGVIVLNEIPSPRILLGGTIVISVCAYETWRQKSPEH